MGKTNHLIRKTAKFILYFFALLVLVPFIGVLILQIPSVQDFAKNKITENLSRKLNAKVRIDYISVGFSKDAFVKGIYLEDQQGDTLLYARELGVNISFLRLLQKEILIKHIRIEDGNLIAYRSSGDKDFNFTFIVNAFADTTKKDTSSAWKIHLGSVALERVKIRYHDSPLGIFMDSRVESLSANVEDLDLAGRHLMLHGADIDRTFLALSFKKPEIVLPPAPAWTFSIKEVGISQSRFIYTNHIFKPGIGKIDYNRMDISSINGSAKDIVIKGKNVALEINELALQEKSGFVLKGLAGVMDLTEKGIAIEVENFQTPFSSMDDLLKVYIPLSTNSISEMSFDGNLKEDKIAVYDLHYFIPDLDTIHRMDGKTFLVSGRLKGKLTDFEGKDVLLVMDKATAFDGDIRLKGMPFITNSYADIKIRSLNFNHNLVSYFIPGLDTLIKKNALGNIRIKGTIKGSITTPAIYLSMASRAGGINAHVNLKTDTLFKSFEYRGTLTTSSLDLKNILVKEVPFGKMSMTVSASGKDEEVNTFKGKIAAIEYKEYTYQNVEFEGSMLHKVLNTKFISNDKSLNSNLRVVADLGIDRFSAEGIINYADLRAMNLIKTPLLVKTIVKGDISGSNPDSIIGELFLTEFELDNTKEKYGADSVKLSSFKEGNDHVITMNLPEAEGILKGRYSLQELPLIVEYLVNRYQVPKYPMQEFPLTESALLTLKAGDISELVQMAVPEITVVDSLNIYAAYKNGGQSIVITSSLQTLTYGGKELKNSSLNATGDNNAVNFFVESESLKAGENLVINEAQITGDLSGGSGLFNVKLYDQNAPTHVNIDGIMVIDKDTFYLNVPSAEIVIRGDTWNVDQQNSLVYADRYLVIDDFNLSHGEQKISIDSRLTSKDQVIDALFQKVHLDELAEVAGFSSYKLEGKINGKVTVNDPAGTQVINAALAIDSLGLNSIIMGNLSATGNKRGGEDFLALDAVVKGIQNDVRLNGQVSITGNNPMDLNLKIGRLPLKPFEPLVKSFAYSMQGSISGNFTITGKNTSPVITGILSLDGQNRIGINLSNTIYKIDNQKISFKENSVEFNRFIIKDTLNNEAYASGHVYHQGFKEIRIAMSLTADKFQLINSGPFENALVYGQLFTRMNARLIGPWEDLDITVDATTLKGSRIYMPLASAKSQMIIPSYVHFNAIETAESDSLARLEMVTDALHGMRLPDIDFSKFTIDGTIRITTDAEINIVVDPINGDKITARGDGTFTFNFDSHNNINLYGVYTIENGSYSFSFITLVKKNFSLEKGSSISWTGDFENAALNINAIYVARVSRYELIADQTEFLSQEQVDAAKRPLPVEVYLTLTGRLLTPEINFRIKAPEGSDVSGGLVTQQVNQINNSPNEVTRHAFSLIVLNRFATTAASGTTTSGGNLALNEVNQSVSRVLNNQLNQLSDDYLEGLDINVNIQSLDPTYGQLAQNAQVMVTKQINNRISVSAGGNVNINSNYGSGQFAGDYAVLYRVNPAGTINLKFFRTSMQSIYTSNLTTQTGASVNYKREFSRWSRIFKRTGSGRRETDTVRKDNRSQN